MKWVWHCLECDASGEGTEDEAHRNSTVHLFTSGHSVRGDVVTETEKETFWGKVKQWLSTR